MENETLEEQAERLASKIIENEGSQSSFKRDDEPSSELQQLIVRNLREHGYKAEFYRYSNEPLGIMLSKIRDDEQDEIIGVEPW